MQGEMDTGGERDRVAPSRSPWSAIGQIWIPLVLLAFGVFYLMLTMGAATFIHECRTPVCGQLHQAVFAGVAALAVFGAAYRFFGGHPSAASITFLGTVPILVVHVILVITDPNESMFFPLSTTPLPAVSGAVLFSRFAGRRLIAG